METAMTMTPEQSGTVPQADVETTFRGLTYTEIRKRVIGCRSVSEFLRAIGYNYRPSAAVRAKLRGIIGEEAWASINQAKFSR